MVTQKKSVRLAVAALVVGLFGVIGFSLFSQPVHAATQSFVRVNNQTIKGSFTSDPGATVSTSTRYYRAETPQEFYGSAADESRMFWGVKESDNNPTICSEYLYLNHATTDQWTRFTTPRTQGACGEEVTSTITVNNSGSHIYFFKAGDGIIRTVDPASSDSEFTRLMKTDGLGLSAQQAIYIQTKPLVSCPRLLVAFSNDRWGFIAPKLESNLRTDNGSKYYQSVMANNGMNDKGGCWAGDHNNVRISTENAMSDIVGGDQGYWADLGMVSFHDIAGSILELGNAVGDESAAELKLGTAPAGSTSPSLSENAAGGATNEEETCNVTGIGWMVCPVAVFLAGVTDAAYGLIENLLVFSFADNALDTTNPVYLIWSNIRNLANIAFIFAFFFIIFSQATSIGIGSYGIKKMLPRLVVAAILVNLSYFICVLGIDISNIIGAGIDGIIRSVPLQGGAGTTSDPATGAGTWTAVTMTLLAAGVGGAAVAAAGGILASLAAALPFLVTALFAVITALVVLVARQAIIILLVIIAPLAFVAYILPNTEGLFEKWKKLFISMLVFYPLVAILFAGSSVASSMLRLTANTGDASDQLVKVMSLAVAALPLFGLPFILKFSGGVLGRIGGMVNNPNKGPFDKLRKRAEGTRDTVQGRSRANALGKSRPDFTGKRFGRTRNALVGANVFSSRRAAQSAQDRERALNEAKQAESKAGGEYYASRVVGDEKYAKKMAGGTMFKAPSTADLQRVQTTALAQEKKAFNDRVGLYQTSYSLNPKGADTAEGGYLEQQMLEGVQNNNREQTAAAINRMSTLGLGGRDALRRVLTNVTINDEDMRQTVINSIYEDNFPGLVGKAGDVAKGGFDKTTNTWSTDGALAKLGSEQLATQDLTVLQKHKASIAPQEAYRIVHDAELSSKVQNTEALAILKEVAGSFTPPTPSGQIIIPRGTPSGSNPRPTPSQDEREAGGRFNGPS